MIKQIETNKYTVLVIVTLGTILTSYVSSSINIALPNIMQVFGFTMDSVIWVSLAYMLPYGSILPITGKLGDQFGRKRMYLIGLAIFTVATLLAGMAWNSTILIFFRIVQGIGAGLLFPNSMALVSEAFPPQERGQALGLWGALAAAGSALGPTIGGMIVEHLEWRLIFYSILPIAAAALLLGARILQESKAEGVDGKIDYAGGVLLVLSLSCVLLVLNQGADEGWSSLYIVSLIITAALSMLAFLVIESIIEKPMVDLTLFKNPTFTISNIVGFLSYMAMFGGLFLLPFYLRNIQGFSAIKAGVSMLPLTLSMVLLAPIGGKLATKYGSKIPASLGMAIMAWSLYTFRLLNDLTPYSYIAMGLIIMGIGLALTMSPLSNGVMGSLPKDKLGVGSGVFNLFKNIGGSVGVAIMGTLLDTRQVFHAAAYKTYLNNSAEAVNSTLAMLQGGFIQKGFTIAEAKGLAISTLNGMVSKQASIAAFGDVFFITAIICASAVIPALFISDPNKAALPSEKSVKQEMVSNAV
ncbi:DHA2 family efflux MFS transporter permease subunit [Dendrosporobacter sp. 1207_IL3150]|uniref:DHA2 family efflux MFS transporter permease subunit n=1 Tax=Dendrosporobacter sp. 1207_IL3150 TaxID=3084054 RepID=UPI002FDAD7F4